MVTVYLLASAVFPLLASAHDHSLGDLVHKRGSGTWQQARDHPVYDLFGRATQFAEVGTPAWTNGFPPPLPLGLDVNAYNPIANIKPAWKAALDTAVKAGKIPNIPFSTDPTYKAEDKTICSATTKSCRVPGDVWDAPDGVFASSFDDGPLPPTTNLIKFLQQNQVTTTHFMVGTAMLQNVEALKATLASKDDLAVHTWSHRQQTTLSNEHVVGELGWTMQLIYNSTGGKLPKYWRPPTGDTDARVSAIAREVFGLTTVIWNQDSQDWTIGTPEGAAATQDSVTTNVKNFIANQPKTPGLMVLEHELSDVTVNIFMSAFPDIAAKGWKFMSLASAYEGGPYQQNAAFVGMFGEANAAGSAAGPSAGPSASGAPAANSPGKTATQSSGSVGPSSTSNSTGTGAAANSAASQSSLSFFAVSLSVAALLF